MPVGAMHAAKLERSPRLQRVYKYLRRASDWRSTRDIVYGADVMAVNSCVSELRANGIGVDCEPRGKIYVYRLRAEPEQIGMGF